MIGEGMILKDAVLFGEGRMIDGYIGNFPVSSKAIGALLTGELEREKIRGSLCIGRRE